jgi:hypothetical protein
MSRSSRPAEWYAFGCSGFGTAHDYLTIRHYILDYNPEVVVMLVCANDYADCSPYLARQEPFQTTFYVNDDGGLVLTPSRAYRPNPIRRILAKSALVRYFWLQNPILPPSRMKPAAGEFVREGAESLATDGANRAEILERHRKTWVLVESLLERCRDECARNGATFAIAVRGNGKIVAAAETGTPYQPVPEERDPLCLGERLLQAGDKMVRPIADRLGIPFLDLTPALVAKVRATGKIHDIPGDGHYSSVGHEAAGEALAVWIETLLDARAGKSSDDGAALKSGE